MSAPRRSVEGFLSRRIQSILPRALVMREADGSFVLEGGDMESVGLGNTFNDAKQAVEALISVAGAREVPPLGSAERRVYGWKRKGG